MGAAVTHKHSYPKQLNQMSHAWTLLGIILIASVACGPAATPTPTPDLPRYSDGEAIAVVKVWIGDKTYIPNPRISCLYILEILRTAEAELVMDWGAYYLGDGVWVVTLSSGEFFEGANYEKLAESEPVAAQVLALLAIGDEWQVYEYSGKVTSISTRPSYVDHACR